PGAIDGISKCFKSLGGLTESELLKLVTERQAEEFDRLGLEFPSLWGRPLQLIDCQNLFCEISKYSRVFHPDVEGIAKRTRIKQKYRANDDPIDYWYPPKWKINDRLPSSTNEISKGA
ncbi:putative DNA base hypermodification protein, partial [Mariniblastus sp.]|nr:putative DNA base hypermodification protein [Mariniblastus sp.]